MTARYGMVFPEGTTNQQMNDALVELAKFEMKKVKKLDDVYFIHHFGLLQYHYGFPPHFEKETVPLPGDPPSLQPFPGGNPAYTNSPEAMPDGVHPMPEGYVYIVDRCYNAYYKDWLKETPEKAGQEKRDIPHCWVP